VLTAVRPFRNIFLALTLTALGCHAQPAASSLDVLSPATARRVEVLIRSRSNVPPDYKIEIGPRKKSDVAGYDAIEVNFVAEGGKASRPVTFLLSNDGKTLAQFTQFDISKDPKDLVSAANRPARGGSESAPVTIVVFDDLECPFCAKMHAQMFPALIDRYKNQVRVVYRDFPLDQHPWAMRAAIDTNCLAAQSSAGYWNVVDYIHLHAGELGGDEKSLAKANETLDTLTRDEGKRQKVNVEALNACILKQDNTQVKASMKEAEGLGVDSTPALFINGEKLEGAVPMEFVYQMVDGALTAAGQTPPPATVTTPPVTTSPATKPGN
jgi:protein-disulfide isomerase